jgi:hypothetical protein
LPCAEKSTLHHYARKLLSSISLYLMAQKIMADLKWQEARKSLTEEM